MTLFDEPDPPPAGGPARRLRLVVAYHGAGFHGFAAQAGQRTVGGVLIDALSRILRQPVELTCAGRTDKGVHGWGQVVHCDVVGDPDLVAVQRAANKLLGPAIVVRSIDVAPPAFDARRTALSRRYWYTVLNRPTNDPFLASTAWHVPDTLDVRAMRLACDAFLGEHDFAAFCRKAPRPGASSVRRVLDARWDDMGDGILRFDIVASAFCHQMVRSIVGTHVDVGLGRTTAGEMAWIIASGDRANAGAPAPPHGLCLREVTYPAELAPPA